VQHHSNVFIIHRGITGVCSIRGDFSLARSIPCRAYARLPQKSGLVTQPPRHSLFELRGAVGEEDKATAWHSSTTHIYTALTLRHKVDMTVAMASINRYWLQVSAFIAFVFFVITAFVPFVSRVQSTLLPSIAPNAGPFKASKLNVWADLSREEAQELTKFLFSKPELNLTEASKANRSGAFPESGEESDDRLQGDSF
jgi:hypothetical protein